MARRCVDSMGLSPRGRRARISGAQSARYSSRLGVAIAESVGRWAAAGTPGLSMLTLTYRSEVREVVSRSGRRSTRRVHPLREADMLTMKKHVKAFLQALRREGCRGYVGWLEFQGNGTPHYHLLIPGVWFASRLSRHWLRITGQADIRGCAQEALTVTRRVGSTDYLLRLGASYARKEGSKRAQKVPPGSCRWTGRWWYASDPINADSALFIMASKTGRVLRRWMASRNGLALSRAFMADGLAITHRGLRVVVERLINSGHDLSLSVDVRLSSINVPRIPVDRPAFCGAVPGASFVAG